VDRGLVAAGMNHGSFGEIDLQQAERAVVLWAQQDKTGQLQARVGELLASGALQDATVPGGRERASADPPPPPRTANRRLYPTCEPGTCLTSNGLSAMSFAACFTS
jgi:hypothetical protein